MALAAASAAATVLSPVGASLPMRRHVVLDAVACTAPNACMVVGFVFGRNGDQRGYGAQWNGQVWSAQALGPTSVNLSEDLSAVSCPTTTECFAGGSTGPNEQVFRGLGRRRGWVEVWSGGRWRSATVPHQTAPIGGLSCASPQFCVATDGRSAVVWNGSTWKTTAFSGGSSVGLDDVACPTTTSCVAVGSQATATPTVPLAEVWNGASWTPEILPSSVPGDGELGAVSCAAANSCTAVGQQGAQSLVDRWDGQSWTEQPFPPGSGPPKAVSCVGSGCVATVPPLTPGGGGLPGLYGTARGAWAELAPTPGQMLDGVSCVPGYCMVVGTDGLGALADEYP